MSMLSGSKFAYVSVYYSVCSTSCVSDGVGELFVECVCYLPVCSSCFAAEGDCVVVCLGIFLFHSPCIVLHSVCVFLVCDPIFRFRCSFHIFVLCCIRKVISRVKLFSVGSHGLRVVSLSVIFCLICYAFCLLKCGVCLLVTAST